MGNNQEQLESLDLSIEQAKEAIALKDNVLNLTKNTDFKKIIEEGYFEKEASRLVLLRADVNMQGDKDQAALLKAIDAVGNFRQYLSTTIHLGRMAEQAMEEDEKTREEILAEDLE